MDLVLPCAGILSEHKRAEAQVFTLVVPGAAHDLTDEVALLELKSVWTTTLSTN